MNLQEISFFQKNLNTSGLIGCDSSISNIFLYKDLYKISWSIKNDILFRQYSSSGHPKYAFPIPLKTASPEFLKTALKIILKTENPALCLITQKQKNEIDECLRNYFPKHKVEWKTDRSESDYVYLQKNLAELNGEILQKKRNHVSKFLRTYENSWEFKIFPQNNIASDILKVEELWYEERNGSEFDHLTVEKQIIREAVENAIQMNITGGVLYVNQQPVAMTLASPISNEVLDIHFEKAILPYANNGAYAVINQFFAKTCTDYLYLNREEDLGIEGLRKAKLSYKPEIILDKFSGIII